MEGLGVLKVKKGKAQPEAKCPHDNALDCPLYMASHTGSLRGCDDGRLDEGGCAVNRGMNYEDAEEEMYRPKGVRHGRPKSGLPTSGRDKK